MGLLNVKAPSEVLVKEQFPVDLQDTLAAAQLVFRSGLRQQVVVGILTLP